MKALTFSLKKSRMRKKSYKTVNLTKINIAHREACAKHPKFCDEMKNENFDYRFFEACYKEHNSKGPYYALDLLLEEIFEAMVAHQYNEKQQCLEELAQCGAVILRMMQFVQDEMEA